jgi:hypothetical protein
MRIIPVTAAAALVLALAACAPTITIEPLEVETEAPAAAETEADLSMYGDLIQDFPEADTAALTALSERLDALVPSAAQVDVRVSIFEPGEVVVRVITVDGDTLPSADELFAVLRELDAFTGSEVTLWTVDAMAASDGTWVKVGPVAAEAGFPEQFVDTWGDIEISPADLRAALS